MISFHAEQIFLVTGASSGIGKATALLLNALGATVIASGRDTDRLEASRACCAHPDQFWLEPLDLTARLDALPDWIKQLKQKYGKLSGLIPFAGHSLTTPLSLYAEKSGTALLDIHFHAPMLLAKGFADRRNNVGPGASIVFMSAVGAFARPAGLSTYASIKGAIVSLTGCLAKELAPQKIRVNAVAPGLVNTPMAQEYLDLLSPAKREAELASYPLGLGRPEDIAHATAFLLSDKAAWITGQTLRIDGGGA